MIYVIGDSNTHYLSCDKERILTMINGTDIREDMIPMSVNGKDITLIYYSGKAAYNVSYDYLVQRFKNFIINSETPIFFQFGAIDIRVHLYKYNNTEDVVRNYVKRCVSFCQTYGLKPIFIQPFACVEHIKNNLEFNKYLRLECEKLKLPIPIEVVGSFIERDYKSEVGDVTCHLTIKDNFKLLEFIVNYQDL
jgi:hypothetical protein